MGTILMIMAVPFLYATGLYNPTSGASWPLYRRAGYLQRALLYGARRSSAEISGTLAAGRAGQLTKGRARAGLVAGRCGGPAIRCHEWGLFERPSRRH